MEPAGAVRWVAITTTSSPSRAVPTVWSWETCRARAVPAALMVSTVHSALRLLLDQTGRRVPICSRAIESPHRGDEYAPNKFITFFMAEVDCGPRAPCSFLNAGHNPAILMSTSGRGLRAGDRRPSPGTPTGELCTRAATVQMEAGDLLCIYSDGITEAVSVEDEEFGVERLVDVLTSGTDRDRSRRIISTIDRATADFAFGVCRKPTIRPCCCCAAKLWSSLYLTELVSESRSCAGLPSSGGAWRLQHRLDS